MADNDLWRCPCGYETSEGKYIDSPSFGCPMCHLPFQAFKKVEDGELNRSEEELSTMIRKQRREYMLGNERGYA